MKIAQKYSHLNGEEYLIVHHKKLYDEIIQVIESIDAEKLRTKISKEKKKVGSALLSPIDLNKAFNDASVSYTHLDVYKRQYENKVVGLDSKFNSVSILNLFGLLGWGIDAATGSLKKYDTKVYEIKLDEKK